MPHFLRALVAVLAVAFVADVASAQRQPGRQPGRQQGGGLKTLVLSSKELQEELKVTSSQKEKFEPLVKKQTENREKMQKLFGGGERPSREEMQKIFQESGKVNEEISKSIDETLTKEQKERLTQIERQMRGIGLFTGRGADRTVVEKMKFTDTQKEKLSKISNDMNAELTKMRPDFSGGFDREKMQEAMKKIGEKRSELTKKGMDEIYDLLDDSQKKVFQELLGEPFDTSKLPATGFGGGGFGGGGFGGGGFGGGGQRPGGQRPGGQRPAERPPVN